MNERQLITEFHNSNPRSFDALFDRLYPSLCYYAGRIVEDPEEAKDIVSECFITLWNKDKADFAAFENIRAFLYTAIRNACLNSLKKTKRQNRHHKQLSYSAALEANNQPDPAWDRLELESEILAEVAAEIDNLPERCREVFVLSYIKGMKRADIARLLNISEHTVRNQVVRALQLLRTSFSHREMIVAYLLFLELQEIGFQQFTNSPLC